MTATIAGAIILAEILMVGDSTIANVAQGANPQDGCEQRQKAAETRRVEAKGGKFFSLRYDEPMEIGNYDVTVTLGTGKGPCASYVKFMGRRLAVDRTETKAGETKSVSFTARVPGPYTTRRGDEKSNRRLQLEVFCDAPQEDMPAFKPIVAPAPDSRTIYLCGDSTVTDQRNEPWGSWGQILPAFVTRGWAVSNFARSGLALKTFEGEGRLTRILEHLKKDDWVVIQFGHNDQKIAGEEPGNGYTSRLNDWIDRIRAKGAFVVLVTPVERRRFDETTGEHQPKTLADYAEAVKSVAAAKGVPFIDLNDASYRMQGKMGAKGSCAIQCNNKGKIDNTHHNVYGAYEMARIVAAGLAEIPVVKDAIREAYRSFDPERPDANPNIPPSGKTDYTKPAGS
ncbi:MAG: rhamnogalacturonan acetylesterase [Lentisphaerae bacterium]|nr:rhamnogalacturonan acetylesterase [Lentisphaerota bacterium]